MGKFFIWFIGFLCGEMATLLIEIFFEGATDKEDE